MVELGRSSWQWADFVVPSTLQFSPLLDQLIEPVTCVLTAQRVQLGLHEALVNAVRHGNAEDATKCVRVRRILTPHWLVWQVQDEGQGYRFRSGMGSCPVPRTQ